MIRFFVSIPSLIRIEFVFVLPKLRLNRFCFYLYFEVLRFIFDSIPLGNYPSKLDMELKEIGKK